MPRSRSRVVRLVRTLAMLAPLGGCAPYATLHAPRPLPPGEPQIGVGIALPEWFLYEDEDWADALTASLRVGVGERTDLGLRVGRIQGVSLDVKRLLVDGPILVSGDLALSVSNLGVHPALIVGTDHAYGGAKLMIFGGEFDGGGPIVYPGVFAGLVLGRGLRILPEIAVFGIDGPKAFFSVELQCCSRRDRGAPGVPGGK